MNVDEIKSNYSMKDVLMKYGLPQPNRSGFIHCPFHRGDNQASMKIYDKDFHCFSCGSNGDIFTFVMLMDGISFKEAFGELGGKYKHDFPSKIKIYHAQKKREMEVREEGKRQGKKRLNNLLIAVYMKYLNRLEPLSDAWCDCYNALQMELYRHEILNDPEEKHGFIKTG